MVDDVWGPAEIQNYCILCRIYWPYEPWGMGIDTLLPCPVNPSDALCFTRRRGYEAICGNPGIAVCASRRTWSTGVFHTGVAGFGILLGPTCGYLIGFILAALVVGLAYEHESVTIRITGLLAGTVIIYICGVAWLMYSLTIELSPAIISGVLPFIPVM